jgi:hypothetical protein
MKILSSPAVKRGMTTCYNVAGLASTGDILYSTRTCSPAVSHPDITMNGPEFQATPSNIIPWYHCQGMAVTQSEYGNHH